MAFVVPSAASHVVVDSISYSHIRLSIGDSLFRVGISPFVDALSGRQRSSTACGVQWPAQPIQRQHPMFMKAATPLEGGASSPNTKRRKRERLSAGAGGLLGSGTNIKASAAAATRIVPEKTVVAAKTAVTEPTRGTRRRGLDKKTSAFMRSKNVLNAIRSIPRDDWQSVLRVLDEAEAEEARHATLSRPDSVVPAGRAATSTRVYNTCISRMAKCLRWGEALDILARMSALGVTPNTYCVNSALDACGRAGRAAEALELIQDARAANVKLDVVSFNAAIPAANVLSSENTGQRGWEIAKMMLLEMDKAGVEPNSFTFYAAIRVCSRSGEAGEALRLIREMRAQGVDPFRGAYNAAMSACRAGGAWQEAVSLLTEARESGLPGSVFSHNLALSTCAEAGRWEEALSLLENMKTTEGGEADAEPDVISHNICISACARAGRWEEAVETLRRMSESGTVSPDVISFSSAISACQRAGQWEIAVSLLREMPSRGLKPNSITYNAAMTACVRAKRGDKALELFEEMAAASGSRLGNGNGRRSNVVLRDQASYNCAITACDCVTGGDDDGEPWRCALEILRRMPEEGVQPDVISYNSAIAVLGGAGRVDEAVALLREMIDGGGNRIGASVMPDTISWNSAISAAGNAGDWELALELLREMISYGERLDRGERRVRPDMISYSTALKALAPHGRWKEAQALLREMPLTTGVAPNPLCYSQAIAACGAAGEADCALALLEDMNSASQSPSYKVASSSPPFASTTDSAPAEVDSSKSRAGSALTYSAAIAALGKSGRCDLALKLLEEDMPARGVPPHEFCYNSAMMACGIAGEWERAMGLLEKMRDGRVEGGRQEGVILPSETTYTALISAVGNCGEFETALSLLGEMRDAGHAPGTRAYEVRGRLSILGVFLAFSVGSIYCSTSSVAVPVHCSAAVRSAAVCFLFLPSSTWCERLVCQGRVARFYVT